MFELADRLVGIYKTNDATKSVTINPKLFDAAVRGERKAAGEEPKAAVRPILADTTNVRHVVS